MAQAANSDHGVAGNICPPNPLQVKHYIRTLLVPLALALSLPVAAQTAVQISDILRSPFNYDRTQVSVSGNIKDLKIDSELETFRICTDHCIWVLAWGHTQLQEGQFLTVSGEFRLAKPIGPCTLKNIIVVQKGTL